MGTGSNGFSFQLIFQRQWNLSEGCLLGQQFPAWWTLPQSGEKHVFQFALIRGFRKLYTFGAGLNDLTGALRIFLQDPGQTPSFLRTLPETICHSEQDLAIS